METTDFRTEGVCSDSIRIKTENGIIREVSFEGGCPGNLMGISRLTVGMTVKEAVSRLSGIPCGDKDTSCPDQLAKALRALLP